MSGVFNLDAWQQCADYVIPVLLGEQSTDSVEDHFWKVRQFNNAAELFPPGRWRDTWYAVAKLTEDRKPVHQTTLMDALHGHVSPDAIALWYAMYIEGSTLRGSVFDANVSRLQDYSARFRMIQRAEQLANDLRMGELTTQNALSSAMTDFAAQGSQRIAGETAQDLATELRAFLDAPPPPVMMTGIGSLDGWIGGMVRGRLAISAAPKKQRKTSLLLNALIHMAQKGHSVALMMFESDRRTVGMQVITMLACKWLISEGLYGRNIIGNIDRTPVENISADDLMRAGNRYKTTWGKERRAAVDNGIKAWKAMESNFRIYDRRAGSGSLSDIGSVFTVAMRDKLLYGTDYIGIDHAQRINVHNADSDYAKLLAIAPRVEELARTENIAINLLAQMRSSAAESTGDTLDTGIRGGSSLDEAADYVFINKYRTKNADGVRYASNKLIVGLQHNRYGDGGTHKRVMLDIDPFTGWILNGGNGEQITEGGENEPF